MKDVGFKCPEQVSMLTDGKEEVIVKTGPYRRHLWSQGVVNQWYSVCLRCGEKRK